MPPVDLKDLLLAKGALKVTEKPTVLKDMAVSTLPNYVMYRRDLVEAYSEHVEKVMSQLAERMHSGETKMELDIDYVPGEFRKLILEDVSIRLETVGFTKATYHLELTRHYPSKLLVEMNVGVILKSEPRKAIPHVCSYCKELDFERVEKE